MTSAIQARPVTLNLEATEETLSEYLKQNAQRLSLIKRPEPAQKIEEIRDHLQQGLLIVILGEFSSGKSTFINAFLGEEATSTSILPETATINIVRFGANQTRIYYRSGDIVEIDGYARERLKNEAQSIHHTEIFCPIDRLQAFSLVDTPGLNSVFAEHEATTRNFLHRADVILWVFDAFKLGKLGEKQYLEFVKDYGGKTIALINKVDLAKGQHDALLEFLKQHFGSYFNRIFLISARETFARRKKDPNASILTSDGFAQLEQYLFEEIAPKQKVLKLNAVCRSSLKVTQLAREELTQAKTVLLAKKAILDDVSSEMKALASRLSASLQNAVREETDRFFATVKAEAKAFIVQEVRIKRALHYLSSPLDTKVRFEKRVLGESIINSFFGNLRHLLEDRFKRDWGRYTQATDQIIDIAPSYPSLGEEIEKRLNDVFFQTVERVLAIVFMTIVLLILFVAFWTFWIILVIPFAGIGLGLAISTLTLFGYRRSILKEVINACEEYQGIITDKVAKSVELANRKLHHAALDQAAIKILGYSIGSGEAEERIFAITETIEHLNTFQAWIESTLFALSEAEQ